jgi:hypothetical protein
MGGDRTGNSPQDGARLEGAVNLSGLEIRNPKPETNSKGGKGKKSKALRLGAVLSFGHLDLELVSDFGFRISDLSGGRRLAPSINLIANLPARARILSRYGTASPALFRSGGGRFEFYQSRRQAAFSPTLAHAPDS